MYLFALQIYGDFAGYTDIARGVSRLFGIELCLNFRQPYLSSNITEFWRRWHISLSSWLRDYLYIPLGGNRKGKVRTYFNLFITMLLGGLWHGANWTFVIWGGLHGFYLAVHKFILHGRKPVESTPFSGNAGGQTKTAMWSMLKWGGGVILTFHLVCLAWIFFRADSVSQACDYIHHIFVLSGNNGLLPVVITLIFYLFWMFFIDIMCFVNNSEVPFNAKWPPILQGLTYAVIAALIIFVGESDAQPFIYFQF